MNEFTDFLKHKFAFVAIGEFQPGKFEEAKELYSQAVSTYMQGFQGAYLLQKPGTDKGIAVIFWNSLEDMQANENEEYRKILKKMNPLFACAPDTDVYELVSEIPPSQPNGREGGNVT